MVVDNDFLYMWTMFESYVRLFPFLTPSLFGTSSVALFFFALY